MGDSYLGRLCHSGNLREVRRVVERLNEGIVALMLGTASGQHQYTPLHVAATYGHHEIMDYLLTKAGNTYVNFKARDGSTALHLAVSGGFAESVRVLLKHGADITLSDQYGRTPLHAELPRFRAADIRKILKSEELIREVENDSDKVTELLKDVAPDQLEPDCLNKALEAATFNNNYFNIGKLVIKGADNLQSCLVIAQRENQPHAQAMLLLIMAAFSNNMALVSKLFGETLATPDGLMELEESTFPDVQKAVVSGKVSTVVPIEIARRCGHSQVREELLLKTDVNQEKGYVYWYGLRLLNLDAQWLKRISWVKKLKLARNGFESLPSDMGDYLREVVKIDLQYNELATIPPCLLELPCLRELKLAHNRLTAIPDTPEWSDCLTVLNLSHNELTSLPRNVVAPAIRSLNLSSNSLCAVPLCVCSFTTLHFLNLSDNPDIPMLPAEMGRLGNLNHLYLNNLKHLNDPPKSLQRDAKKCIQYLNSKLRHAKPFFCMKLMVVGQKGTGKTTLVKRMKGKVCGDMPTVGVDVCEWCYKPSLEMESFHFSIWDFSGQEEYYATHQFFLSQRSLYLLVFNLRDGEVGIRELKPWLNNIALRAPDSLVIIVATHLDEVPEEEREEIDLLLNSARALVEAYSKLKIAHVMPVGLEHRVENIKLLKETIYNVVASYQTSLGQNVMGQKVPVGFHTLDRQLKIVQQEVRQGLREPVMHSDDFCTMVQQLILDDIQDKEELKAATNFLTEVGSLLHFDDCRRNLSDYYFPDPQWLCKMMSKIVTTKEKNPNVRNGILYTKDIPALFVDDTYSWKYFDQYLILLDHLEISLSLDEECVLILSMLPEARPEHLFASETALDGLVQSRLVLFNAADTPPGLWSRLLSRIMHSVPQVRLALDDKVVENSNAFCDVPSSFPSRGCNVKNTELYYWRTGLYYSAPDSLTFRIESLNKGDQVDQDGILIVASPNHEGKKTIGHLVDLVMSVIGEWYPGLMVYDNLEQKVPCFECLQAGRIKPYQFEVKACLPEMTMVECKYHTNDPDKNHSVKVSAIVPDMLFQDMDPMFLLSADEVNFKEDNASLIGKGTYGALYRGKYRNQHVSVKRYIACYKDAITQLRLEVRFLQQTYHPCLLCLVGVYIYPFTTLVMEEPPLCSLEFPVLKKKVPIHRLSVFRIAAEVASALHFLHDKGIIFRNLKLSNVLLWTLDPASLCHCKVTDFRAAAHLAPMAARRLQETKGHIAPEVLCRQHFMFNHQVDIFSFGMLLYQMVCRRLPYHDTPRHQIDALVKAGQRPRLQDVNVATTGYFYLTMLMKRCWEDDPQNRPTTEAIIKTLTLGSMQSVMGVHPIQSNFSLRRAIALTPSDTATAAGVRSKLRNELWVFCDGVKGAELIIYDTHSMVKIKEHFIKGVQVHCMALSNGHVWVGSRAGIEDGFLDIFDASSHEQVHTIKMKENSVSCLAAANDQVLVGTMEGYCFSFSSDVTELRNNSNPRYCYISDQPVDGVVFACECIWASNNKHIHFLNPHTLEIKSSVDHDKERIGQLAVFPAENVVWSAHVGGVSLAAWDASNCKHLFDIDTSAILRKLDQQISVRDSFITAMTPALDTVWVGMATGHILVMHEQDMLMWYQPYKDYVRFLCASPGIGPCGMEKCMIISGGKQYVPLVKDLNSDCKTQDDTEKSQNEGGVLIAWEAFEAKATKQVKLVEEYSPHCYNSRDTIGKLIGEGEFRDGTHINHSVVDKNVTNSDDAMSYPPDQDAKPNLDSLPKAQPEYSTIGSTLLSCPSTFGSSVDSLRSTSPNAFTETSSELTSGKEIEEGSWDASNSIVQGRTSIPTITSAHFHSEASEMFEIELPELDQDSTHVVCVECPKPTQLQVLLSELGANASLRESECHLEFCSPSGEMIRLETQDQLETYLAMSIRPKLYVAKLQDQLEQ